MAGHSKWAQIKRAKGAEDARKSIRFGILAKKISLAAKLAKGDLDHPALRQAIEEAKKESVPKETIDRAVKRAVSLVEENLAPFLYEGYGPGGVAILIEGAADNLRRLTQEIKLCLKNNQGNLAPPGAAIWAFEKEAGEYLAKTTVSIEKNVWEELAGLLTALENISEVDNVYHNGTRPENL